MFETILTFSVPKTEISCKLEILGASFVILVVTAPNISLYVI